MGCFWLGIELEERFWTIGNRNLALWRQRFGYETGALLQGDSRKLQQVLQEAVAQGLIYSPPYQDQVIRKRDIGDHEPNKQGSMASGAHSCDVYGDTPGNLGNLKPGCVVASPPFASSDTQPTGIGAGKPSREPGDGAGRNKGDYEYPASEGQLGQMPVGAAMISSPPYAEAIQNGHSGIDKTKGVDPRDPQSASVRRAEELAEGYGISEGQLGAMKPGCVITSPPFCESLSSGKISDEMRDDLAKSGHKPSASGEQASYGTASGQLASLPVGNVLVTSPPYAEGWHAAESTEKNEERMRKAGYSEEYIRSQFRASHAAGGNLNATDYGITEGQLGRMKATAIVSSPPFGSSTQVNNTPGDMTAGSATWGDGTDAAARVKQDYADYAADPGNLGRLPMRAVVTSPPFLDQEPSHAQQDTPSRARLEAQSTGSRAFLDAEYGRSEGQLGVMKAGSMVTSPPFGEAQTGGGLAAAMLGKGEYHVTTELSRNLYQREGQGTSAGQLAAADQETFWGAARTIMAQSLEILVPGSVAAFVLKDYVRDKKIVPFCAQWRAMCESVGFVFVEEIHAMLVEDHGTQSTLFGAEETIKTERKSFFRRLAENKGSPRIDYEVVLILQKPVTETDPV